MNIFKKKNTIGELGNKIDGNSSFSTTLSNKYSKWPRRKANNRIEPNCEPAITPTHKITPTDKIFAIGSCFARNIELALKEANYDVPSANIKFPQEELFSGTKLHAGLLNKYTPQSMLNELEYVFNNKYSADTFLVEGRTNEFYDFQLHTDQSVSFNRGIQRRNDIKNHIANSLNSANVIILTLGLVETWWDNKNKIYLNETPPKNIIDKYPNRFFFETMSPSDVFNCVSKIIKLLRKNSKNGAWIMLTVSPIPLARTFRNKDVITANMYSKSVLRVAAEIETEKADDVEYFPSYESVMLSERESIWQNDLIHLEYSAIKKIMDRVISEYS